MEQRKRFLDGFWRKYGDLIVFLIFIAFLSQCFVGCASVPKTGLEALKAEQRTKLYKACIREHRGQMMDQWVLQQAGIHMNVFAIHDGCRNWAQKAVR
jgi:hypothetical protein